MSVLGHLQPSASLPCDRLLPDSLRPFGHSLYIQMITQRPPEDLCGVSTAIIFGLILKLSDWEMILALACPFR